MNVRRRGRGEGSIVQRADGRWMARVDLGWQGGKRRSKAIYGRTRRAVADALQTALRSAQEGTLVADERQTVPAFLARWLQDVARTRVRPRTLDGYEAAIERHISPYLGRVRLSKLTPQHLQAWMATLETQGVSAGVDMPASCSERRSTRPFAGASLR
jgi:integrase